MKLRESWFDGKYDLNSPDITRKGPTFKEGRGINKGFLSSLINSYPR
jgi:hypothetical protein